MIPNDAATRAVTRNGTDLQRGRASLIALWLTQAALAVVFLMAGGSKLVGAPAMVSLFDAIGVRSLINPQIQSLIATYQTRAEKTGADPHGYYVAPLAYAPVAGAGASH